MSNTHNWREKLKGLPSDYLLLPLNGKKVPIDPNTGLPQGDWGNKATHLEQICQMNGKVQGVGLLLGKENQIIAVDFDGPEAEPKFSEVFGRSHLDLPPTVSVTSGKPSRRQCFFRVDKHLQSGLKGRGFWKAADKSTCLELRWEGHQSVIAGDHPETAGYYWLEGLSPAEIQIAPAPEWLLIPLREERKQSPRVKLPPPIDSRSSGASDTERAAKMLTCLPPEQYSSYDDWLRIGMALSATDPGLLSNWVAWSKGMPNFNSEAECLNKWKSFKRNSGGYAIGTLHNEAKKYGYKEPKKERRLTPSGASISRGSSKAKPIELSATTESIDVEAVIDVAMLEKPFKILGWCAERKLIHYQHRETGQIASFLPVGNAASLLKLAMPEYWGALFPTKTGTDWIAATASVAKEANTAGVFALDRVRGRGLWMDGGKVVWHLGDRLEINGVEVALVDHRSAYHYPRLTTLDIDPTTVPLSNTQGVEILKAVQAIGWGTPFDYLHILGWCVLANVGGALEKRPALQITSKYSSGKSHAINFIANPLLAGLAISRSNGTEASIRQTIGADTLPVIIDESEEEDPYRRAGHLKLARLSFDGIPTSRGTPGGKALTYAVRSSVALAGINAAIPNGADRSRFVVVSRKPLPQEEWVEVSKRIELLITAETGAQLLRRAVSNLPALRANIAVFRRIVEGQLSIGGAARAGDTYGALLAGAHLLVSTERLDDAQAIDWLDRIGWDASTALGLDKNQDDSALLESVQCLGKLLSHEEQWRFDGGTGKISVRELIQLSRSPSGGDEAEQARKALGRRGIKTTDHALLIANSPELLHPIYGNSKWRNGGHRDRLLDLPGSDSSTAVVRFKVVGVHKATSVVWSGLES